MKSPYENNPSCFFSKKTQVKQLSNLNPSTPNEELIEAATAVNQHIQEILRYEGNIKIGSLFSVGGFNKLYLVETPEKERICRSQYYRKKLFKNNTILLNQWIGNCPCINFDKLDLGFHSKTFQKKFQGDLTQYIKPNPFNPFNPKDPNPVPLKLSEKHFEQAMYQMVLALFSFHQANTVHGDVKPPNFLFHIKNGLLRVSLSDLDGWRFVDNKGFLIEGEAKPLGTLLYCSLNHHHSNINYKIADIDALLLTFLELYSRKAQGDGEIMGLQGCTWVSTHQETEESRRQKWVKQQLEEITNPNIELIFQALLVHDLQLAFNRLNNPAFFPDLEKLKQQIQIEQEKYYYFLKEESATPRSPRSLNSILPLYTRKIQNLIVGAQTLSMEILNLDLIKADSVFQDQLYSLYQDYDIWKSNIEEVINNVKYKKNLRTKLTSLREAMEGLFENKVFQNLYGANL